VTSSASGESSSASSMSSFNSITSRRNMGSSMLASSFTWIEHGVNKATKFVNLGVTAEEACSVAPYSCAVLDISHHAREQFLEA
jgi:hypothetical protein